MEKVFVMLIGFALSISASADVLKDFDSLGGNDVLMKRAKILQPNKKISIVQNRTVKRKNRSEFSLGSTEVLGGNVYLETQSLSLNYYFHLNPKWTVGASYYTNFNQLSAEANRLIEVDQLVPDVDQVESGYDLIGQFSPIYGKFKFLNMGVVQFDIYGLGTVGSLNLKSGRSLSYSYGAGVGFWVSQHLTVRLEVSQRSYQAETLNEKENVGVTSGSILFGYLL